MTTYMYTIIHVQFNYYNFNYAVSLIVTKGEGALISKMDISGA